MEAIARKTACEFSEPTEEWCPPLAESLGNSKGEPRPGHFGTAERFNDWVTGIWEPRVHPRKSFSRNDFTRDCLMIDPFSRMCGAVRCSRYFQLLFLAFPDLSGKHYSWAENGNTIFVYWAFFMKTDAGERIVVPSIDIFGFKNGRVNYRLAEFDRLALVSALIRAYPKRFSGNAAATLETRLWLWHASDRFAIQDHAALVQHRKLQPL